MLGASPWSLWPDVDDFAAQLVTFCSVRLLLKTLCRAHYKLIIPVPHCLDAATHTLSHAQVVVSHMYVKGGTCRGAMLVAYATHSTGCGVEIFCPLAKHNMKRIIFIIPTPIHCPEERSISWAKRMEHSTIRSQNPAATIPALSPDPHPYGIPHGTNE